MAGEDTQSVGPHHYDTEREGIDAVSRRPVMILIGSGITWLVIGSIFGLMASLKLHWPDWLTNVAPLTFGRVRTLHLNLVIYGWLSMTGIGVALWI
ncbi:MAG: cbb3-type cytochrome c oxidase subunit I, partial [Alphaproteobacteria bacterium]|nr:cbb3-type cytochrome c oxidase subunit I [Alphaproteobacteria bacterium]